jgi:hypothetical protein
MSRVALIVACAAVVAAALPSPGLYAAMGLGIAAIGTGLAGYRRRDTPGVARLGGAAAIAVGAVGLVLGTVRVAIALAAIDHLERLI